MIRRATEDDIPRLVEMGKQSAAFTSPATSYNPEKVEDALRKAMQYGFLVVNDNGGEANAAVVGALVPEWFSQDLMGFVLSVFVDPKYRGAGIAQELLDAFENWAKESGAACVYVSSPFDEWATESIYQRRGYQLRSKSFRKDL